MAAIANARSHTNASMNKTFVIGDIHGAYRALRQCLERAEFNYETDYLISLGDVADGWPETNACISELLKIKNLTYVLGNHDWWTLRWMRSGEMDEIWYSQGGKATVDSYTDGVPPSHIRLLRNAHLYHTIGNKLFVHAGIDPNTSLDQQDMHTFLWDRKLASLALQGRSQDGPERLTGFEEVYVGHTPIPFPRPVLSMGVWLMDTGAGWSGVLSMMELETKEVFTSDPVPDLYPGIEGRKRFR